MNTHSFSRTLTRSLLLALVFTVPLALAACGGDTADEPMEGMPMEDGMMNGGMTGDDIRGGNGMDAPAMSGTATEPRMEDGVQVVEVTVGADFEPDAIRLQAGTPARLAFTRTTDQTCATEVQVPAFGVEKTALPLNEEVAIAFTPEETGTFAFTCGMDMMRGTIVVED